MRCLSPISVRRLCPPVSDDFGLYLTSAKTSQNASRASDVWKLARATRIQIAKGLERDRLATRVAGLQAMLSASPTPKRVFAAYRRGADHQIVISNVGRWPAATGDQLRHARHRGFLGGPNLEEEPVVGVATVNRRVCISLVAHEPIPELLGLALTRLQVRTAISA